MIAERQRAPSVRERFVHDIEKLREWVREHIRISQKPELDEKVKRIDVKKLLKKKVIASLGRGVGKNFGRKLGGFARRLGSSVARIFGF